MYIFLLKKNAFISTVKYLVMLNLKSKPFTSIKSIFYKCNDRKGLCQNLFIIIYIVL